MPEVVVVDPRILDTWEGLNESIRDMGEDQCLQLLALEKGRVSPRLTFLLRIHSRLNKVRADREREELVAITDKQED